MLGGEKKMETIKDKHTQLQSKNSADTWMMQQNKKKRIKAEKQQRKQEILQTQQKSESKHYTKKNTPKMLHTSNTHQLKNDGKEELCKFILLNESFPSD